MELFSSDCNPLTDRDLTSQLPSALIVTAPNPVTGHPQRPDMHQGPARRLSCALHTGLVLNPNSSCHSG